MPTEIKMDDHEFDSAQLELLMRIYALQKATVSFLCDRHAKTIEESDEFYRSIMDESSSNFKTVAEDISIRRGVIDINDLLPRKKP